MKTEFNGLSIAKLEDVYGDWLTANGFNDEWLTVDDLRYEHGDKLTYEQREWLAAFEKVWNTQQTAEDICDVWVDKLGIGFHPDTRGADYSPKLSEKEIAEYDRDMEILCGLGVDQYEEGMRAWVRAGLVTAE